MLRSPEGQINGTVIVVAGAALAIKAAFGMAGDASHTSESRVLSLAESTSKTSTSEELLKSVIISDPVAPKVIALPPRNQQRASRSGRELPIKHHSAHAVYLPPNPTDLPRLRECESSNNYKTNTGNGFYGAYQFDLQTFHGLGYSGLPSDASIATQDEAATILEEERGWQPWPSCSKQLGLIAIKAS